MLSAVITRELEAALRGLHYGSIQLVVHDAKIVRIERVERIRLPAPPPQPMVGGPAPPIGGAPARPATGVPACRARGAGRAAERQAGLTGTPEAPSITTG